MSPLAAARAAVGARYRLHGRDVATGLDCVGLASLALRASGYAGAIPSGYALRSGDGGGTMAWIDGVLARTDTPAPGDLLLFRAGPGQLHLAVRSDDGLIHADASLRRVVERPGAAAWPLIAAWKIGES